MCKVWDVWGTGLPPPRRRKTLQAGVWELRFRGQGSGCRIHALLAAHTTHLVAAAALLEGAVRRREEQVCKVWDVGGKGLPPPRRRKTLKAGVWWLRFMYQVSG